MNPETPAEKGPTVTAFWPVGILTALVSAVAVVPVHRLWDASLRVPFNYSGDANSAAMVVKAVLDHGWYTTNRNLGAPFVQHFSDYPFSDNLHLVVIRMLGLTGASYPVVLNLYYLLGYVLVAIAAVWALRRLGVSSLVAIVTGVLYSFLTYHQTRGEGHLFLGAYFVVPLACFLVLRSLEDQPVFAVGTSEDGRRWPRRVVTKTNLGVAAMCVLIGTANSYYAVFTLLLLALVLVVQAWQRAGVARFVSTVVMAAVVAATFALGMAPNLLYESRHGTNTAIAHHDVEDSERYGLKLTSVLLPREYHRIRLFARVTHKYGEHTPIDSEQGQSFGLIGGAGLALLLSLVVLSPFRRRRDQIGALDTRLQRLGALSLFTILVATVGGLSSVIALFVPEIRAWNRISVFTAFFVFLAIGLALDQARRWSRVPSIVKRGWPAVLAVMLVVGIFDQTRSPVSYQPTKASFASDGVFVHSIERVLGKNAMVFQLPYNPFPEYPGQVDMAYYDELRGYLHSSTLRWSYGAVRGRPEGDWQEALVAGTVVDLVDTVSALGFDGIYVDRFGYADHGAELEHQLGAVVAPVRLVSPDHRLVLFDLRAYARTLRATKPARVASLRAHVLDLADHS